jgi:hypothetical protein
VALALLIGGATAFANAAVIELSWQEFDTLSPGDKALAEGALAEKFGDDPTLWPDWIDPKALLIPIGRRANFLVVREPQRTPCGEYRYTVFGPPDTEGHRPQLGQRFCAGDLQLTAVKGKTTPDLEFLQAYDRGADNSWQPQPPLRRRWGDGAWLAIAN